MAKRQNRLAPIQHEIRQLIALKSLEPNATPADARLLSERLIDVAVAAQIAKRFGQNPWKKQSRPFIQD